MQSGLWKKGETSRGWTGWAQGGTDDGYGTFPGGAGLSELRIDRSLGR